jgi:lipopolysaccharide export LptBFGC system permease protein LptF
MFRRFPKTILRMLGSELGRLVLVSASVLVSIIAFSAAIKPLSDGTLTPGQALAFMALASPPMLMYALPFAAGFAATLAYHRFGADNEANAAYAGGVSHRAVLLPAFVVGVALLVVMLVLQHSIIPRFLRGMEELVTRDVAQLLENAVSRGDSLRIEDALIHADSATRLEKEDVSGARERLLLEGVLAVGPTPEGTIGWEATAQRAIVWLFDADAPEIARPGAEPSTAAEGSTVIVLQLFNQSIMREGQGASRTSGDVYRFAVPGAFSDDPKFRDWNGLRELRRNPDPIASVDRRRRALAQAIALDEAVRATRLGIEGDGVLALVDPDGQWARLTASGMQWDAQRGGYRLLPPQGETAVELLWRLDGGRARIQRAKRVWLRIEPPTGVAGQPVIALEMEDIATREPGSDAAASAGETTRRQLEHRDLKLPQSELEDLFSESSASLLARAEERGPIDAAGDDAQVTQSRADIAAAAKELRRNSTTVRNEALALMHERVAMSIACLVMTLAGAVAALRLSDARPLLVYMRSFVPSLLTVIAINSGQNVTTENGPEGLFLLWGGLGILGVFTLIEYLRLVRH